MSRKLKNWLDGYLSYTEHLEAPSQFHFWTGVFTIAGALQRKVYIDCGAWDWVPNFYLIFVAPPGIVSKSTTASIGHRLLKKLPPECKMKFGPDSCTWQVFVQELAQARSVVMTKEGGPFVHSSMSLTISELGTFLKTQDGEMIDTLVALWDGQRGQWRKATKSQGEDKIESPWINFIAGTTPSWIESNFPEYMVGGGFTSRTIFIYANKKRKFVAYPGVEQSEANKELEGKLLHDLTSIAKMEGQMKLDADAIAFGTEWYNDFMSSPPEHLANSKFEGYIARKQTHIHKLAMVLSAAESDSMIITADHLEKALALMAIIEKDMPRVFGHIGMSRSGIRSSKLAQIIKAYKKDISLRQLYSSVIKIMSFEEYKEQIQNLIAAGLVTQSQVGNELFVRATPSLLDDEKSPLQ